MSASEVLTPTVETLVLTVANTQYTIDLAGVQHFSIQSRAAQDFRFAWVTGKVAGSVEPFMTCKSGQVLNAPEKCSTPPGLTLYVASANAGQVLEILKWQRLPSV